MDSHHCCWIGCDYIARLAIFWAGASLERVVAGSPGPQRAERCYLTVTAKGRLGTKGKSLEAATPPHYISPSAHPDMEGN